MIDRPCAEPGLSSKARRAHVSASRRVVSSSTPSSTVGDQAYTVPSIPYSASLGPTTESPCSASARAAAIPSEEYR